jgi:hypothetical protein
LIGKSHNPDLLYSLACEFLASFLTMFYVLDKEFGNDVVASRVETWLSEAIELGDWLEDDKYRTDALKLHTLDSEDIMSSFLEQAYSLLKNASNLMKTISNNLSPEMCFYYIYVKSYLVLLNKFDDLVRNQLIRVTNNYEIYLMNGEVFNALKDKLAGEISSIFQIMNIDESRLELDKIVDSSAAHVSKLWEQFVNKTYEEALKGTSSGD